MFRLGKDAKGEKSVITVINILKEKARKKIGKENTVGRKIMT
jgi:hypothetical protein